MNQLLRNIVLTSWMAWPLCACQRPAEQAAAPAATSTAPSPATAPAPSAPSAMACPAPTFEGFFKRFADDVAVQKAYVTDPLQSDSVDAEAEPEPAPVHKTLKASEIAFPVLPTTTELASKGLNVTTEHPDPSDIAVTVSKPDTDDQKVFHFRPSDGCWTLYRIDDQSL